MFLWRILIICNILVLLVLCNLLNYRSQEKVLGFCGIVISRHLHINYGIYIPAIIILWVRIVFDLFACALLDIALKEMESCILQPYSYGDKEEGLIIFYFLFSVRTKYLIVFYRDDALNTRNFHDAINTWLFDVSHFLSASWQNDIKWEIWPSLLKVEMFVAVNVTIFTFF